MNKKFFHFFACATPNGTLGEQEAKNPFLISISFIEKMVLKNFGQHFPLFLTQLRNYKKNLVFSGLTTPPAHKIPGTRLEFFSLCSQSSTQISSISSPICEFANRIILLMLTTKMNISLCKFLALSIRTSADCDQQVDPQLIRLDNMLSAEGVEGSPEKNNMPETGTEQADYRQKLQQIRHTYHEELDKYNEACQEFTQHVKSLLQEQVFPFSET